MSPFIISIKNRIIIAGLIIFPAIFFIFTHTAQAAISFDSASSAASSTSVTSISWSHTVGSGSDRILVVGVSVRKNSVTVSSITYGGVGGFTQAGTQIGPGADQRVDIWYKVAPTAGTANVVVTISGAQELTGGAASFTGVDQTTPVGTFVGAQNTSVSPSVTVSSAADELVIDVLAASGDSGAVTVGDGQTQRWSASSGTDDPGVFGSGSTEAGAASVTMSWTLTISNKWALGAVPLKPSSDTTAPADITSLAVGSPGQTSMPLTWTAPGDDGSTGTATTYDLRYSTSAITAGNFSSATAVTGEPTPSVAGTGEAMTVTGLSASTLYYFAIKTSDEVPNTSGISNVPSGTTTAAPDTTAPAAVSDLAALNATASSLDISWTAPGDDGSTGTATTYDLRYSTSAITAGNFSSATAVTGEPTPSVAGSSESMTVTGLSANTTYYFALKTSDETPNTSDISNLPSGATSASGGSSPPPASGPSGGGGSNPPRRVIFSGHAYPQSRIEVLRKLIEDETYIVAPTESSIVNEDGSFVVIVAGLIRADYLFAIQAYDKDGRSSGILVFSAPFYVDQPDDLIEIKNILIPPTMAFEKALITKNDTLKIKGYATPNNMVELEVDGAKHQETRAGSSGFYSFDVSVVSLAYGDHRAQVRQVASDGRKSGFSTMRIFQLSKQPTLKTDFNSDGKVNISDWSIFLFQWGSDNPEIRLKDDLNGDGKVDVFDFSIFLRAMTI